MSDIVNAMSHSNEESLPPLAWRLLGIVAVSLLLTAVAGIGLISAGVFDPKPLGPLQHRSAPGERILAAGESDLQWLQEPLPDTPFSARLTAAHVAGEMDAGYGLALGAPQAHLVVAVSPLGYVAVWEMAEGQRLDRMPWQRWPHVRRDHEPNEIHFDVEEDQILVRVNHELLWQGAWQIAEGGVGFYLESFGEPARIEFRELTLYH